MNDEMKNELAEADGGLEHGHGITYMYGGAARGGWRGQGRPRGRTGRYRSMEKKPMKKKPMKKKTDERHEENHRGLINPDRTKRFFWD